MLNRMLMLKWLRNGLVLLAACCQLSSALAMSRADRQELLDAIRPEATKRAGQAVRFRVDTLNYDAGWAVLVGGLMAQEGQRMDWNRAKECEPELDKMLWVVAKRDASGWRVIEMSICATEPPYWSLKEEAFMRPCGIYAGLQVDAKRTVEQQCRAFVAQRRKSR